MDSVEDKIGEEQRSAAVDRFVPFRITIIRNVFHHLALHLNHRQRKHLIMDARAVLQLGIGIVVRQVVVGPVKLQ